MKPPLHTTSVHLIAYTCVMLAVLSTHAGTYRDRDNVRHPWHITPSKVLVWDGKPYLPFGGMYCPRYFFGQAEESFNRDKALLRMIRDHGVEDLYLNPPGLVSPPAMQRIVDLLEELGFHYGLQLGLPPAGEMPGYEIQPDLLTTRVAGTGTASMESAGRHGGRYVVVAASDGRLLDSGVVVANAGRFEVPVGVCPPGGALVKIVPEGKIGWISEENSRRLIEYLRQLRLGPRFRFLLDPIGNEYCPPRYFAPTGEVWRKEFSEFLRTRYRKSEVLTRSWGLPASQATTFEQCARLVPLVAGGKDSSWSRIGYAFDDVTARTIRVDLTTSRMWKDLCEAREVSFRRRLNLLCDEIKRVCDVPLVAKRHHDSTRIWINRQKTGGLDGLGMESYGTGEELGYFNGAATYADIAQAGRPMWCLATEYNCTHWENRHISYRTREQMYSDLNLLLGLGARGVFMFGLSLAGSDGDKQWTTFELANDPRQLEWLATFGKAARSEQGGWINRRPDTLYWYPTQNDEARAFAAGDMPDYGLSGAWHGDRAIRKVGSHAWVAPAFYADAPGTVLYSPELFRQPSLSVEAAEVQARIKEGRFFPSQLSHPTIAGKPVSPPSPPVLLRVWAPADGLEAVAWKEAGEGQHLVLRATTVNRTVQIAAAGRPFVEVQLPGETRFSRRSLPVSFTLPGVRSQRQTFILHNPSFGINNAQFECEVGDSAPSAEVTGLPLEGFKLKVIP